MDQVKFVEDISRPYHFKFFKGCHPQILLRPFLNTLTHVSSDVNNKILVDRTYRAFPKIQLGGFRGRC